LQAAATAATCQSLHQLQDHRGGVAIDVSRGSSGILPGHEIHVEGRARKAIPALGRAPGNGGGSGGAAVEAVLQGHDLRPAGEATSHPQRVLVGLGAAVHEEHPGQSRRCHRGQGICRCGPHVQGHRIALEVHGAGLLIQGPQQIRLGVTQRRHRVTAIEIDDAPGPAVEINPGGGPRLDAELAVHLQQVPGFGLPGGGRAGRHRGNLTHLHAP
jgi:hypothetical protein